MEYKRKTEQNVTVMTRQYPITKALRWSITDVKIISSLRSTSARKVGSDPMLSVVILRSLKEVLSGGQMIREENAYTMSGDAESRIRGTDLFDNAS